VLFGKADLLEAMDIYLKGGSTVDEVTTNGYILKNSPWKFEAGTPAIESVVGLGGAINFLLGIGMDKVQNQCHKLAMFTQKELQLKLPEVIVLGDYSARSSGHFSLNIKGVSSHLLARGLSYRYGICARSGFHCAQFAPTIECATVIKAIIWTL